MLSRPLLQPCLVAACLCFFMLLIWASASEKHYLLSGGQMNDSAIEKKFYLFAFLRLFLWYFGSLSIYAVKCCSSIHFSAVALYTLKSINTSDPIPLAALHLMMMSYASFNFFTFNYSRTSLFWFHRSKKSCSRTGWLFFLDVF